MIIFLGILKFIFGAIAIFSTGLFILSSINSIINPTFSEITEKIEGQKDKEAEKYDKFRYVMLFIMSIAWGIIFAL